MVKLNLARLLRHLLTPPWFALRRFPPTLREEIAAAVAASECLHRGELRIAIEGPLSFMELWRDIDPRERAVDLFSQLRVWDTAENSGILIYLQLLDRSVEILADRGIAAVVPQSEWNSISRSIETTMQAGDSRTALLTAIESASVLLAMHFPARRENPNELPDHPLVI